MWSFGHLCLLLTLGGQAFSLVPEALQVRAPAAKCDCTGANDTGNAAYLCGDPRLGPKKLPKSLPLSGEVYSYNRLGGLTPAEFLAKWTDSSGYYVYPPQNGYLLNTDGHAIKGNATLSAGTLVDRFGSEYGSYISAADAPFNQRALPPSNLDTNPSAPDFPYNYHVYEVAKDFVVEAGPIAPWFSQPGLGAQFYIGYTGNIMQLVADGYLTRVPTDSVRRTQDPC